MQVDELLTHLRKTKGELLQKIRLGKYKLNPVRRVEIPKEKKGKVRELGIPTVVDRVMQQAIAQVLMPIFEKQFHDNSYGFRPNRSAINALKECQRLADEGYVYVVDMDVERFFDKVSQSKLIEILSRTISDGKDEGVAHQQGKIPWIYLLCCERQMQIKTTQEITSQIEIKTEGADCKK